MNDLDVLLLADEAEFRLDHAMLGEGLESLRVRVTDATDMVRLHTLQESYTWFVEPAPVPASGDWMIFY